jgi:DNA-directed RNA polymerase specialized sigma24 family protein
MTTTTVSLLMASESISASAEQVMLHADESENQTWRGTDPDLWLYRNRTIGLLKRYLQLSVEVGRLPSLLGREFFRTQVTSHDVTTFEDSVIFVHDMDQCLEKLGVFEQELIAQVVFQDYSQDEAADSLKCWRRKIGRRFPEVLDEFSDILLESGLLTPLPGRFSKREKVVKRAKMSIFLPTHSEQSK